MPTLPTPPFTALLRQPGSLLRRNAAAQFRRILSGSETGEPAWVRALERGDDAGWFGPDSAAWAVHGSLATLVGGIRALLLQATHPLALAGVEEHSDYRSDPLGRLQRTGAFLTMTTFGSSAQAEQAVAAVHVAHRPVVGHAADGRPYRADDPRLLAWVHVGLVDSMLVAAEAYGPAFDADSYVEEMAVVGRAVGVLDPPTSRAELTEVIEGFRSELAGSEQTRAVAAFVQQPPLPVVALPAYTVLARAGVDLLPTWAHPLLGTLDRPAVLRAVDRQSALAVLAGLRFSLGDRSPAFKAAQVRLARLGLDQAA